MGAPLAFEGHVSIEVGGGRVPRGKISFVRMEEEVFILIKKGYYNLACILKQRFLQHEAVERK